MNKFERALDQLKKGIQSYVNKVVENAPYDKTTVGLVTSVNNQNLYEVTIDRQSYSNIPCLFSGMINVGDAVKVMIPQNNHNLMFISGKLNATVSGGSSGTSDYNSLSNQPQINGVTLSGNKTTSQLGINIPTQTSDLTNDSDFVSDANYVHIDVDGTLSDSSTNPVENQAVKSALDTKQDDLSLSIVNGQVCVTYTE